MLGGGGAPEHRPVTIAFIKFEGIDTLIENAKAPTPTADLLHQPGHASSKRRLRRRSVALLASDIDVDGGKLILTAGAPIGDGRGRGTHAARAARDRRCEPAIPIRIGVNRGAIFAGDIGPFYRRTYTVMGDAVNLAARLMAKAQPGRIYATADVLDRSNTLFETTELEPFMVKGKSKPVEAWDVGKAVGSRHAARRTAGLPLTGRDTEIGDVARGFGRSPVRPRAACSSSWAKRGSASRGSWVPFVTKPRTSRPCTQYARRIPRRRHMPSGRKSCASSSASAATVRGHRCGARPRERHCARPRTFAVAAARGHRVR